MAEFQPKDWSKQGYGQLATNIWENPEGFHFSEIDGLLRRTDQLSAAQAQRYGVTPEQLNASTAHNGAIQEMIAKKKQVAGQKKIDEPGAPAQSPPPAQKREQEPEHVEAEVIGPEQMPADDSRMEEVEARDMGQNTDFTLQYEAEFTDKKTGEKIVRRWLSVNAIKLGFIEQYIKQGFSCAIKYEDKRDVVNCIIELKKGEQTIVAEGVYSKARLKSFLVHSAAECCQTFAYRNALRKIVSLKDIVKAVKETQAELQSMGMLPTKTTRVELGA